MSPISLNSLQSQLFEVVDKIIDTGIPVELERKGYRLKIVLEEKRSKLANLKSHDCIVGNPDELVHLKTSEWREECNL